jgi:dTDP-4-amino-4,6-dideoxy-D-galactose acyltransferase
MIPASCCEYLPWDSSHFNLRIARVNHTKLTPALIEQIGEWAKMHSIDCLYFLADPEPSTLRLAADNRFRFVDIRFTLAMEIGQDVPVDEESCVRSVTAADLADLRRISGQAHRGSRFYVDGGFAEPACDELYRIWIERSYRDQDFATAVLVADHGGKAVGYISYRASAAGSEISLVGIDPEYQGCGLGRRLVRAALLRMRAEGCRRVQVVTQGSNVRAQRLYQRSGFIVSSARVWYHFWPCRPSFSR